MSKAREDLQEIMDQLVAWQRQYGGSYVTVSVNNGYGRATSLDERKNPWHSLVHEYEREPQTGGAVRDSQNKITITPPLYGGERRKSR